MDHNATLAYPAPQVVFKGGTRDELAHSTPCTSGREDLGAVSCYTWASSARC